MNKSTEKSMVPHWFYLVTIRDQNDLFTESMLSSHGRYRHVGSGTLAYTCGHKFVRVC